MADLKFPPNRPILLESVIGVIVTPLSKYADSRGWLTEVWRTDELASEWHPAMGYVSSTQPGVTRGPHEHVEQADLFVFLSGQFNVYLWDKVGGRMQVAVGADYPASVLVPPGIVHAYQNVGATDAIVLNFPNRLYRGAGRREVVDEIRHEDDRDNRFVV
jgi:dTDP-4-dehydrorhamnose 3,5-epimerase